MRIIGIDPGNGGGVCVLSPSGDIEMLARMPVIKATIGYRLDVCSFVTLIKKYPNARGYIENQLVGTGMPRTGFAKQMMQYGMLQGAMLALGVPVTPVRVQEWRDIYATCGYQVPIGREEVKELARRAAVSQWPDTSFCQSPKKPHDGVCEAAMIAAWGYLQEYNNLPWRKNV